MGGGMVGQACEVDVGLETSAGPDEWGARTEPAEGGVNVTLAVQVA